MAAAVRAEAALLEALAKAETQEAAPRVIQVAAVAPAAAEVQAAALAIKTITAPASATEMAMATETAPATETETEAEPETTTLATPTSVPSAPRKPALPVESGGLFTLSLEGLPLFCRQGYSDGGPQIDNILDRHPSSHLL